MAKETTKPEQNANDDKKGPPAYVPIDFSKPFSLVVHNTKTRLAVEPFTGDDHAEAALRRASDIASNNDRLAAVIGPQHTVKMPPKEPVAEDMALPFAAKPE